MTGPIGAGLCHGHTPVSVAVVNDYDLIVAGVAEMLSSFPDRLLVRDRIVMGDAIGADIEVALYDTYGRVGIAEPALRSLIAWPEITRVAVFSFDLSAAVIADARAAGAAGIIAKSLSGADIADAIVKIADGEDVFATGTSSPPCNRRARLAWEGRRTDCPGEPGDGPRGRRPVQPRDRRRSTSAPRRSRTICIGCSPRSG